MTVSQAAVVRLIRTASVRQLATASTRVIDAGGRVVIPGINDAAGTRTRSMDFLTFIIGLHGSTGVDIPETDYMKLATIEDAVQYIVRSHGA